MVGGTSVVVPTRVLVSGDVKLRALDTIILTARVLPPGVSQIVLWESSDSKIAKIEQESGKLIGINRGEVTITASTLDGSITQEYDITVDYAEATSIIIQGGGILNLGERLFLNTIVSPSEADSTISWDSDNVSVAGVSFNGEVFAISFGEAVITATTSDGSTATHTVNVIPDTLSIIGSSNLRTGERIRLLAYPPSSSFTWISDNPSVATIDSLGWVTGVGSGSVRVLVIDPLSGKQASFNVAVSLAELDSITISGNNQVNVGRSIELIINAYPNRFDADILLRSSDTRVAIAKRNNQGGFSVEGVDQGQVVVTAYTLDGFITSRYNITVNYATPDSIIIEGPINLREGFSNQVFATVYPLEAEQGVTWSSNNPSIATVSSIGVVLGVNASTAQATIVATSKYDHSIMGTYLIRVVDEAATGIIISQSNLNISIGDTTRLSAYVNSDNSSNNTISWSSSNDSIAIINTFGQVLGLKPGRVALTATNGIYSAKVFVNVDYDQVHYISIIGLASSLNATESVQLNTVIYPSSAANKVLWQSLDERIAIVDGTGRATGLNTGTAKIVAQADGISDTFNLSVTYAQPTSISIQGTPIIGLGKTTQLTAMVSPTKASQIVNWFSNNEQIAQVSSTGVVTGFQQGSVVIFASNSGVTDSITITIETATVNSINITGVNSIQALSSTQLSVNVEPFSTSNESINVRWLSSNRLIATVSNTGKVKGVRVGQAQIYAYLGNIVDTFDIEVTPAALESIIIGASPSIQSGNTLQLTAQVLPTQAAPLTNSQFTWVSSDLDIATVNSSGLVTGKRANQTVRITANYNNFSYTTELRITPADPTGININSLKVTKNGITSNITDRRVEKHSDKVELVYTITPAEAKVNVVFSSSNNAVIKVVDNQFEIVGTGTVVLTVTTQSSAVDVDAFQTITVYADEDGDGVADENDRDSDGDGLIDIRTAEQFNDIRNNSTGVNIGFSGIPFNQTTNGYELMNDIDLGQHSNWIPIPILYTTLEGNNYQIRNLKISASGNTEQALIKILHIGSKIKNLHLVNVNLVMDKGAGLVYNNRGIIENTSISGTISASIEGAGLVYENDGTITGCFAQGNLTSPSLNTNKAGGIVFKNNLGKIITLCHSAIDISSFREVGGITHTNLGTVNNSFSSGDYSGNDQIGGIVFNATHGMGSLSSVSHSFTVSSGNQAELERAPIAYKINDLSFHLYGNYLTYITDSYWDNLKFGRFSNNRGTSLTTSQFACAIHHNNYFLNYDNNKWEFIDGYYPALRFNDSLHAIRADSAVCDIEIVNGGIPSYALYNAVEANFAQPSSILLDKYFNLQDADNSIRYSANLVSSHNSAIVVSTENDMGFGAYLNIVFPLNYNNSVNGAYDTALIRITTSIGNNGSSVQDSFVIRIRGYENGLLGYGGTKKNVVGFGYDIKHSGLAEPTGVVAKSIFDINRIIAAEEIIIDSNLYDEVRKYPQVAV